MWTIWPAANTGGDWKVAEAHSITRDDPLVSDLRSLIPPTKWSTWFSAVRLELIGDILQVSAPSDFHIHWLREHYLRAMEDIAADRLGPEVSVEFVVDRVDRPTGEPPAAPADPPIHLPAPGDAPRLLGKYVFDNFVMGQSNRLALAAAMAVSEKPGQFYNPLFIYGDAGLGKTHLLHAIGHRTRITQPSSSVRYITSENFFNEFVNSIRRKRMDTFKQRYRTIDLLLLDDIQFFQGKEQILEEIFHTFNTLYESDRQMVLSCDRPPRDLGIEERLRSRFQWGLLTDIGPPDIETRLAILRRNAEYAPTPVPDDVLEFIARHVTDNIRQLEGALTRVTAYAALANRPISLELARTELRDLIPALPTGPPSGEEITALVAMSYGFSVGELQGPSRRQPLVLARQIAMYLCRQLTDLSLPKTGKLFGGRDHTTVMHAVAKITRLVDTDPGVARQVSKLSETLCTR